MRNMDLVILSFLVLSCSQQSKTDSELFETYNNKYWLNSANYIRIPLSEEIYDSLFHLVSSSEYSIDNIWCVIEFDISRFPPPPHVDDSASDEEVEAHYNYYFENPTGYLKQFKIYFGDKKSEINKFLFMYYKSQRYGSLFENFPENKFSFFLGASINTNDDELLGYWYLDKD